MLRNDIIEGKYAPGDKISEVDVAFQLNLSRSPIHSAVNELIGEGLLENTPNKPVRVKELTTKQILDIYEYRVLVNCSGNGVVAECYHNYSIMITPFRVTSLNSYDRFKASIGEHSKIIDYILERDVENAAKVDKEHLEKAKLKIERNLIKEEKAISQNK